LSYGLCFMFLALFVYLSFICFFWFSKIRFKI
jgi:hypothetical protein